MSRLLNKAILAILFCVLILLAGSSARAGETLTGDSGINPFSGALEVGVNTSGSYIVDGGSVVNRDGLSIASNPSSSGQVTVTGAGTALSLGGGADPVPLSVGRQGAAVMTISGGAVVDVSSGFSVVGQTAGSSGSLTLTDPGSRLVTMNNLGIGTAGVFTVANDASLNILNGAGLDSVNAGISNGLQGGSPTGTETTDATVVVSGSGSTWTLNGLTIAGQNNATGTLIVSNGGSVSASQLQVATVGFTCIGSLQSVGNLQVSSGALVQVDGLRVGENTCPGGTASSGTVRVQGQGALITSGGGPGGWAFGLSGGSAQFQITQGGQMINNPSTGVMVAPFATGDADIHLAGDGSLFDAGRVLWLGWNPSTDSAGGTCTVTLGRKTVIRATQIIVGPGCKVSGAGTLQGSVINNGGSITRNVTILP
jgi:T5SS/PEP-CTERM-associated repeat protein